MLSFLPSKTLLNKKKIKNLPFYEKTTNIEKPIFLMFFRFHNLLLNLECRILSALILFSFIWKECTILYFLR